MRLPRPSLTVATMIVALAGASVANGAPISGFGRSALDLPFPFGPGDAYPAPGLPRLPGITPNPFLASGMRGVAPGSAFRLYSGPEGDLAVRGIGSSRMNGMGLPR